MGPEVEEKPEDVAGDTESIVEVSDVKPDAERVEAQRKEDVKLEARARESDKAKAMAILLKLRGVKPVDSAEDGIGGIELLDFDSEHDMDYFHQLEGPDGWIAIGMENCKNQRYYVVRNHVGERLGIVGVYDTDDEQNITHIVIDPEYRGRGLVSKFYERLIEKTKLGFLIATISRNNIASVKAHEKAGFKKVSDPAYEEAFDKFKYRK